MTYEEFLQLTEKNLKRFFPESFQERKVEIREVLKNNNIKLQGVYLSGSPSYTSCLLYTSETEAGWMTSGILPRYLRLRKGAAANLSLLLIIHRE